MSADYSHLHSTTRPLAEENDDSRIRRIRTDRWITYSRADAALTAMEDLLTFPRRTRMPNLLLVGPTNNVKTMIVEKFRRAHPPIAANAAPEGAANVSVLKVQMPAGPDEPRFFGAILDELGFPHLLSDRVAKRQDAAVRMLRETSVCVMIVDEVHNLLSGSRLH